MDKENVLSLFIFYQLNLAPMLTCQWSRKILDECLVSLFCPMASNFSWSSDLII